MQGAEDDRGRWTGRFASGSVDITPRVPVILAANRDPSATSHGVEDRLEANILVIFEDPDPIVLISFDLLYVGEHLRRAIDDSLSRRGISTRLATFASHTHSAPATDPTKPALGRHDPQYLDWMAYRVTEAVAELIQNSTATEGSICGNMGQTRHGVNRRRRIPVLVSRTGIRFGRVGPGANQRGERNGDITVLKFLDRGGQPVAVIWNYACHPVGHPAPGRISAHFPGKIRSTLRDSLMNKALPVLYLQGFSGDIRPDSPSTNRPNSSGWRRLLQSQGYSSFQRSDYDRWCASLAERVVGLLVEADTMCGGRGAEVVAHQHPRDAFVVGTQQRRPVPFIRISIGADIDIIGVGAEVVAEYAPWVRKGSGRRWVLPTGCFDDVFGYAPTERMLSEGGYEVTGFCSAFGCRELNPTIEAAMSSALAALRRTTDRSVRTPRGS